MPILPPHAHMGHALAICLITLFVLNLTLTLFASLPYVNPYPSL